MLTRPSQYGKHWTRDELILAFDLYCRIPFNRTKANNPAVVTLAVALNRSPAGVARKLGNFGAFDPALRERNIVGLAHGSKLDREVWDEFHRDWARLVEYAARLRSKGLERNVDSSSFDLKPCEGPSERIVTAKQRLHQSFFREAVLSSYENSCCVTGMPICEILIASHIIPWCEDTQRRADPTNGLCLSATFDRLFDAGMMTIDEDLTVRFSKKLHKLPEPAVAEHILAYHAQPMKRPVRFMPSKECLRWHRQNVFRK